MTDLEEASGQPSGSNLCARAPVRPSIIAATTSQAIFEARDDLPDTPEEE